MLHRAAGLIVAADRELPGFPATSTRSHPDLRVHLEWVPDWADEAHDVLFVGAVGDRGRPVVTVGRSSSGFRFDYADDTRIWVGGSSREVWCTWPPHATLADAAPYLAGPIMAFVLRLRGALALHASAVSTRNGALVLVGPHGAGKSTLAAALALRGARVVADDLVHVRRSDGTWMAEPFAALLRLWPDAEPRLLGTHDRLHRMTPTWNKRALPMGSHGVEAVTGQRRIGAIALLEFSSDLHPLRLDALAPPEALVRLAANTSATHLIDMAQRAAEFAALSDLVRHVRAAVFVRHERASLEAQSRALLDWMRGTDE